MVSGLSALGFGPNAPTTGHSVCKLVTPAPSNGISYPFSFQSLANHSSPSSSNGAPLISFIFIAPRTLSIATGRYTPSLSFSRPPLASISSFSCHPSHSSSTAYKMLLPQLLCFDHHPFSWGCTPPRTIFIQGPSLSYKIFSPCLGASVANFFPPLPAPLPRFFDRPRRPLYTVGLRGPHGKT
jgi:hypothetical protein